jgi:hypothetical protein
LRDENTCIQSWQDGQLPGEPRGGGARLREIAPEFSGLQRRHPLRDGVESTNVGIDRVDVVDKST